MRLLLVPVAQLLGRREFWSLPLRVNRDVLAPRPETETLVEAVLERLPKHAAGRLLEIGTGSGAVALALASERPRVSITATDISSRALELAQRNADLPMIPASNMKLFTTATALGVLGPGFTFETKLILSSPPANTNSRQPTGPILILKGDGDPSFGDPKILAATPRSALNGTPYEGKTLDVELLLQIWVDQVKKV